LNVPDIEGQALNNHYVQISSINSLMVTMNIDETNLEKVTTGQEATIEVPSLDKTYTGNITHISSTGTNGKFEIEIEFENDGDIKLGMTGTVSITI
jgi:multidrug resistance efflux pump